MDQRSVTIASVYTASSVTVSRAGMPAPPRNARTEGYPTTAVPLNILAHISFVNSDLAKSGLRGLSWAGQVSGFLMGRSHQEKQVPLKNAAPSLSGNDVTHPLPPFHATYVRRPQPGLGVNWHFLSELQNLSSLSFP